MVSFRVVSGVNGMVNNTLKTLALADFLQIFGKLLSCFKFMGYEPVKLFKAWNKDAG